MVRKLHNFDDWIDYFRYWQDSIGLPQGDLRKYGFEAKFGEPEVPHIEFGHYKGQRKWPTVMHIPDQRIRDALLNLIVYQGDTEFASVEQQRNLLHHAPSAYDLLSLQRVMTEEMRHGWQMSYLLCSYFGDEGKREAAKLLERRADEGERLLGSFNEIVDNWLDFFTYTQFIDRDGKFQLKMLSVSAFDPLSRSMGPMLKEESYHLGTGNNGLLRIVKAGKMPPEVIQRFFYKWIPTAFDLFGTDNSSSAHWAYVWGLKGRYDERENPTTPGRDFVVSEGLQGPGRFLGWTGGVRVLDGTHWWGEGEVKMYFDGEERPTICGTGTEDYVDSAWGLGPFAAPESGAPLVVANGKGHERVNHRLVSFYRWHLSDAVVFERDLRVTVQQLGMDLHGPGLFERSDDWCATAFTYCAEAQRVHRVDLEAAGV